MFHNKFVVKYKEFESAWPNSLEETNLAKFSKKCFGQKRAVLSIMMMIMMKIMRAVVIKTKLLYTQT
jgi:hypothetical protein